MKRMIRKYKRIQWSDREVMRQFYGSWDKKALAMTTDCNARYIYLNPEIGGQIAVAEAARNISRKRWATTSNHRLFELWLSR